MTDLIIRDAAASDFEAINQVISEAIDNWDLPDRVKRLSLSSHLYNEIDLKYFRIIVAEEDGELVGLVALDNEPHAVQLSNCLLLHGIYVRPDRQRCGIGGNLLEAAEDIIDERHLDGVVVKAQKDANNFFISHGLQRLAAEDVDRDYANRFWKPVRK